MTRAFCSLALALCCFMLPLTARAALEADPAVLYAEMKAAYAKAAAANFDFTDQEAYLSTVLNAGRAYSLQNPNDPAYGEVATLAVQIASGLHYDPLTNHDAATWYVREAANWVIKNSQDAGLVDQAKTLLAQADAEEDPATLARIADQNAMENLTHFPGDSDARLRTVEADWRAYLLTRDSSWRSLALQKAADPNFPIGRLPTSYGPEFVRMTGEAVTNFAGTYTSGDQHNAAIVQERLKHLVSPLIIASTTAMPHDVYLSTLAPADEYFGPLGFSVLGIQNELTHINFMLNYNYGNREAASAEQVAVSIDDMHKVYPRDRDMPKLLLSCIATLHRMTSGDALAAAAKLQSILTVEYQDSPEARKVLAPPTSP